MGATLTKGYTFSTTETVTSAKLSSLVDDATITKLTDADGDTQIQTEESSDEDIIRFDIGGTEVLVIGDGTNEEMVKITNTGTHDTLDITASGIIATGKHALIVTGSGVTVAADAALVKYNQSSASATEPSLEVVHAGIAAGIEVGMTGNGSHMRLTGDPTVASPVDGDLWFTGSALNFRNGASTVNLLQTGNLDSVTVGPGGDYSTITLAMAAVSAGDTIFVAEGTYSEVVTFTQDSITLKAVGSAENTIITNVNVATASVTFSTKSNCVIDGFTVTVSAQTTNSKYGIHSANDGAAGIWNTVQNCYVNWTSAATAINCGGVIWSADGDLRVTNCVINGTVTETDGGSLVGFGVGNTAALYAINNKVILESNATGTKNVTGVMTTGTSGTCVIRDNYIRIDSDVTTTGYSYGIQLAASTVTYCSNNEVIVVGSSTGVVYGFQCDGAGQRYITGNTIHTENSDGDAEWIWTQINTDYYATNNTVTGDGGATFNVGAGTVEYMTNNVVNGILQVTNNATVDNASTCLGAFFGKGFAIGADSLDAQFDDATNGSGTTTMYLGTYTIDTTTPSDELVKKNIIDTKCSLIDLNKIAVKDFKYKQDIVSDGDVTHTGMLAQDIEKICPDAVFTRSDEFKAIDYKKLIPLLIKSIQELSAEVTTLKNA